MALPKRRFSRSRRDKRRLQLHLAPPTVARCPRCGATVLSHRICRSCGYYRGRSIIPVSGEREKRG